ncbi:hypothetical protein RYX36_035400 [Vicia faba]
MEFLILKKVVQNSLINLSYHFHSFLIHLCSYGGDSLFGKKHFPSVFSLLSFNNTKTPLFHNSFPLHHRAGLITGFVTEYYTSNAYSPVQDVIDSCRTGVATNVIFGLVLGYKSIIIPFLPLQLVFC